MCAVEALRIVKISCLSALFAVQRTPDSLTELTVFGKNTVVMVISYVIEFQANLPPAPSEGGGETPSLLGRVGEGFLLRSDISYEY